MDLGDIIGITGLVFRTQKGQMSVHAQSVTLLTKSLKVLPEKYHGLKDPDLRYRQRYLDMIVNPEVRDTFRKRSQIISAVHANFLMRGVFWKWIPRFANRGNRRFGTHLRSPQRAGFGYVPTHRNRVVFKAFDRRRV